MKSPTTTQLRAYYNRLTVLGLTNYLAHESERKPVNYATLSMLKRMKKAKERQLKLIVA